MPLPFQFVKKNNYHRSHINLPTLFLVAVSIISLEGATGSRGVVLKIDTSTN